jgi:hypothetical protein
MKAIFSVVITLVIPGLGHALYGSFVWGIAWLCLGLLTGGFSNLVAAVHMIAVAAK